MSGPERVDGFDLHEVAGEWVIADGSGWLPGVWKSRDEALAGGHAYSQEHGYCPK
jgi:hypothetical protein